MPILKRLIEAIFLIALCVVVCSSSSIAQKRPITPYAAKLCVNPLNGVKYKKYTSCGTAGSGFYCDGDGTCCTSPNMQPSCQPPPR